MDKPEAAGLQVFVFRIPVHVMMYFHQEKRSGRRALNRSRCFEFEKAPRGFFVAVSPERGCSAPCAAPRAGPNAFECHASMGPGSHRTTPQERRVRSIRARTPWCEPISS